jgi:hypothetical protein
LPLMTRRRVSVARRSHIITHMPVRTCMVLVSSSFYRQGMRCGRSEGRLLTQAKTSKKRNSNSSPIAIVNSVKTPMFTISTPHFLHPSIPSIVTHRSETRIPTIPY